MTIQHALAQLLDGQDLSRAETRLVMGTIMAGEATPAQIGGFLVALRLKGETADEIAGAAEAMREHVIAVKPTARRSRRHRRHRRRRRQHVQHLDRRRARRRGRGRGRREARQPLRVVAVGLRRRARGAGVQRRSPVRADRAVDRRARLRVHVRAARTTRRCGTPAPSARSSRRVPSSTCSGR